VASYSDLGAAAKAVADPSTPAADLADIASHHPSLWAGIAAHPAASPTVLDSLAALGDDQVKAIVAARRTAHPEPAAPVTHGRPTAAQQVAAPPPQLDAPPPPRPHRWLIALLVALALVVGGVVVASQLYRPATPPAPTPSISASVESPATPLIHPGPPSFQTSAATDEATPTNTPTTAPTPTDDASAKAQAAQSAAQAVQSMAFSVSSADQAAQSALQSAMQAMQSIGAAQTNLQALTVAQFTTLYTSAWPKASGEKAMSVVTADLYPSCVTSAAWLKQRVMAQVSASSNTVAQGSQVGMILMDSNDSAGQFYGMLGLCFHQSVQAFINPTGTVSFGGIPGGGSIQGDGTTMTILSVYWSIAGPEANGQHTNYLFDVWRNVILVCQYPSTSNVNGADPFGTTLIPAFMRAVDQAAG